MPGGHPALNVPLAAHLAGPLDLPRLEAALNAILVRHEILRTSLKTQEGEVVQVIHPSKTIQLTTTDCTQWPEDEQEVRLHEAMVQEGSLRFQLTEAPLLRARLLKRGEWEHVLLLTTHHVVCDGWSQGILLHELATTYSALATGSQRPELPLQYADFAHWQEDWLRSEEAADQRDYWTGQLKEPIPLVNLPTDRPRRPGRSFPGGLCSRLVDPALADQLKAFCLKQNLTPAMVYLAAYGLLLRAYSGHDQILTGSTAANRGQTELEDLIGFFANPILVRLDFSGNPTLRQLLRRVRELSLMAFANQSYPFEKVASGIPPAPHQEWLQWLQVYFVYQKTFLRPQEMAGVQLTPMHSVTCGALFEWTLVVIESEEGIRLQLEYDTELFDASSIEQAFADYEKILTSFLSASDLRLGDMEVLAGVAQSRRARGGAPAAAIDQPAAKSGAARAPSLGVVQSPRPTPTQLWLGDLWRELLGVETIGTGDHFFELGGKSLATLRLVAQIEQKTGRRISPVQLLEHPTLAALAQWLDHEKIQNIPRGLLPLHAEGSLPPLFFVMEGGTDPSELKGLAARLGATQPSFGVPIQATREELSHPEKAVALAQQSLHEIQAFQAKGPYFLVGDSFGAGVAYEMARLLVAAGEQVGLLAVVDSTAPAYSSSPEDTPTPTSPIANTPKPSSPGKGKGFYSKIVGLWKSSGAAEDEARPEGGSETGLGTAVSPRGGSLKPYSGKLLLLRAASESPGSRTDRTDGWGQGARGGVEVIEIAGPAGALMKEPAIQLLAEPLLVKLRAAQANGGAGAHAGEKVSC
jgi:thioesterase domain-containing protein/acyl carrier protein